MSKRMVVVLAIVLVLSGIIVFNDDIDEPVGFELPDEIISPEEGELKLEDEQMPSYGHFIENKGQWSEDILFLATTSFGHIGLGKDCVFFDVRDIQEIERKPKNEFEMIDPMFEEGPPRPRNHRTRCEILIRRCRRHRPHWSRSKGPTE